MLEYVGVLHMHSTFSDGSGEVPDIVRAARELNLDYLILTDHNTLRALHEGYEKWYGETMLLVGCEINDKENRNHYIALGINETYSTRLSAKDYVKKVKEAGGIGFLAHPHEKRTHMAEHPPYPWVEWDTNDFTGIEIWNHMSEWMENLTEQNKYQSFLHPLRTITAPPDETLKKWDELNSERRVVGIGGVDAHAHKYNLLGFLEVEIFPYKVLFKSIRTHIITDKELTPGKNFKEAKHAIYDALSAGSCFVANDYHADSRGFRFYAESGHRIYQMGEEVKVGNNICLKVLTPSVNSEIKFLHNGQVIQTVQGNNAEIIAGEKGAYRVEVFLNGKAWIYSNHIRIIE